MTNSPVNYASRNADAGPQMPESQTESQIGQLQKTAGETGRLLGDLERRLQKVLRDRPDPKPNSMGGSGVGAPKEYLVPHANNLRTIREELEGQANDLRSLLERLEA